MRPPFAVPVRQIRPTDKSDTEKVLLMQRSQQRTAKVRRAYPKVDPATRGKERPCFCGCGKNVTGGKTFATDACRKRYQRAQSDKLATAQAGKAALVDARKAAAAATGNDTDAAGGTDSKTDAAGTTGKKADTEKTK